MFNQETMSLSLSLVNASGSGGLIDTLNNDSWAFSKGWENTQDYAGGSVGSTCMGSGWVITGVDAGCEVLACFPDA